MKRISGKRIIAFVVCSAILISSMGILGIGARGCIVNLSKGYGMPGEIITINGSGFDPRAHYDAVYVGGNTEAKITHATDKQLKFMVPLMTPGPYKVSVRTAVGISNEVAFTVQPQSSAGGMQASADDTEGITHLSWAVAAAAGLAEYFRGPYNERIYDSSCECYELLYNAIEAVKPASKYIEGLWVDGDLLNKIWTVYQLILTRGTYNMSSISELLGTCKAFIFESRGAISKYAHNPSVEDSLSGVIGDIGTYISYLPPNSDTNPPKVVFDELPDIIRDDSAEYIVSALACDEGFPGYFNSGLGSMEMYVYLGTQSLNGLVKRCPLSVGYYESIQVKFTLPDSANPGDTIRLITRAHDDAGQMTEVTTERVIGTTYRSPKIPKTPTPTLTPDEVADASALGAAQVYFQCTDSGNDIDKLNVEMVGENLKSRTPYSVSASTLGIPAGGGTVQKTLLSVFGNLTNINNYFDFTKDGWVMLRFWFTDRAGLNGSSATVFLYINSPSDNVEVFKFTVGDVTADDDSFGVALPSWGVDTHSTRIGQTETFVALLSDIQPGQTYVELRIQCDYSSNSVGDCVVKLQDGARFSDGTTQKSNNITYNPGQATPWVLSIRAPQPVKPPRPGT